MAKKSTANKQTTQLTPGQINALVAIALIVASVLFFWFWYNKVYLKSENVFWSTISNNLNTGHVTRTSAQVSEQQSLTQATDLQLSPILAARTTVTLSDKTSNQKVVTETIGTQNDDFLRYVEITGPQAPKNSDVVGVWAKQTLPDGEQPRILADALLGGVLMFGDLSASQRKQLVSELKDTGAFTKYDLIDTKTIDGRKIYTFNTAVNIAKYTKVFKTYLGMIGQESLANELGDQESDAQYEFILTINAGTRQPTSLKAKAGDGLETYSNFGRRTPIIWPTTNTTIAELQEKITN
jgi:hypothetical protein